MKDADAQKKVIQFKKEGTGPLYQDWLTRCYEGYRFKAGDHWDGAEKELLKAQNRPYLTFNRILPVLPRAYPFLASNQLNICYSCLN